AKQADSNNARPVPLGANERHEGQNATFSVVVDAHGKGNILDGGDDDQGPNYQRQEAKDRSFARLTPGQVDDHLESVKRACADVAEHHAERSNPPSYRALHGSFHVGHGVLAWCLSVMVSGSVGSWHSIRLFTRTARAP